MVIQVRQGKRQRDRRSWRICNRRGITIVPIERVMGVDEGPTFGTVALRYRANFDLWRDFGV
jgi:hypothetical protein